MEQNLPAIVEQARRTLVETGPWPEHVLASLCWSLDRLHAPALGLHSAMESLNPYEAWSSDELWSEPRFHLGLFRMPKGRTMPLHDHPHMTVLMRVLWGRVRIVAYDWAREHPWSGLARPVYDRILDGAHETLLIVPDRGNLHRIEALDDCAFLDLLAPPYSDAEGRSCHYYREAGVLEVGGETLTRLVQV